MVFSISLFGNFSKTSTNYGMPETSGSIETADAIAAFRPLHGVYGNIDGGQTRVAFRRWELFECEQVPGDDNPHRRLSRALCFRGWKCNCGCTGRKSSYADIPTF